MKIGKVLFCASVLGFVSGCATEKPMPFVHDMLPSATSANPFRQLGAAPDDYTCMDKPVDEWLAKEDADLLQQYGQPTKRESDGQGGEIWTYLGQTTTSTSGTSTTSGSFDSDTINTGQYWGYGVSTGYSGTVGNINGTNNINTTTTSTTPYTAYYVDTNHRIYSWRFGLVGQPEFADADASHWKQAVMFLAYSNQSATFKQHAGNKQRNVFDPYWANLLGEWYLNGTHGLQKNYTEAVKLFRLGAQSPSGPNEQGQYDSYLSEYNLGYCYEHGLGVEKDLAQAKYWYGLSAQEKDWYGDNNKFIGYIRAKQALARLGDPDPSRGVAGSAK